MAYKPAPSAEQIISQKGLLEKREKSQIRLNEIFLDLYMQQHALDVKRPDSNKSQVRPVGIGEAGFIIDQRTAILLGDFFIRYAPMGGTQAEKHVSGTLEPFVNTVLQTMDRAIPVTPKTVRQLLLLGYTFNIGPMPAPAYWAGQELEEIIEHGGGKKAADEYRASQLPFVWRHLDAMKTVAVNDDKGMPHKVYHYRKMYAEDIVLRLGKDALPEKGIRVFGSWGLGTGYGDSEQVDVIDYYDDCYCITVVGEGESATTPIKWEHHMGKTPITSYIGNELLDNILGIRYAGILMHNRELLAARDEHLTDLRQITREHTTTPPVVFLNPEERGRNPGWSNQIVVEQGKTVNMLMGEQVGRFPVPQANPDVYNFMDKTDQYLGQQVYREALAGEGSSGEGAARLNIANQGAKAELTTYTDGYRNGLITAGELVLRSVAALNAYLETDDPVTARTSDPRHGSEAIEVRSKDVKDYYDLGSCDLNLALPVNESYNITNYDQAVKSGLYDPYLGRQIFGRMHNPMEVDERNLEWKLFNVVGEEALEAARMRARARIAQVGALPLGQMLQNSGGLPDYIAQALIELDAENGGMGLASMQAQAGAAGQNGGQQAYNDPTTLNMNRLGRGQQPSQLASLGVELPNG